jgi:hypothetical protein
MRIILLSLVLIVLVKTGISQEPLSGKTIDFESNNNFILFDPNTDLWQIGVPNKSIFKESYSGLRAIMTDSIKSYGDSISTYFQIKTINNESGNETYLSFWNKWDTDTLNDFGYLDYSLDGGINWFLCEEKEFFYSTCQGKAIISHSRDEGILYSTSVPSYFSGSKNSWVKEQFIFRWSCCDFNHNDICVPDSVMIRFYFKSDNNKNNKDGWIIDDIYFGWNGNYESAPNNQNNIEIYPNPFTNYFIIENKNYQKVDIFDITGQFQFTTKLDAHKKCIINTQQLKRGTYIIKLIGNKQIQSKLIFKN